MESKGIVLIATTNSSFFRYCCSFCLQARKHYDGPIQIFTDLGERAFAPLVRECGVQVKNVAMPGEQYPWSEIRTTLALRTPFELTLSLDVDAHLLAPIDPIWRYLDGQDLALALDFYPTIEQAPFMSPAERMSTFAVMSPKDPQYGSGTILFRKSDETIKFFGSWRDEWRTNHDIMHQYAMNRAVATQRPKFALLPEEYNYSFCKARTLEEAQERKVVVWQGWGNDHEALFNALPDVRDRVLLLR